MSKDEERLRVVFDCNTYVQAVAYERGPAAHAYELAIAADSACTSASQRCGNCAAYWITTMCDHWVVT